jgi:hypothetical protein
MPRNNLNIINANSASITRALVLAVLAKSNLHWEMHHAQVYAQEMQAFKEVTSVVSTEADMELMDMPQTNITLMGLPVIIDNERYPKGLVRLMSGDTELARIECLAVPNAFAEYGDAEVERERKKFAMLKRRNYDRIGTGVLESGANPRLVGC